MLKAKEGDEKEPFKIKKQTVDQAFPKGVVSFRWDCDLKGFGLKVTEAGKKTYIYQYRTGGRESTTKRVTIGEHGSPWTPAMAREEALRLAALVQRHIDPREDERQRRKRAVTLAFQDYAGHFVERYLKVEWKETWQEAERILNRDIVPAFRRQPLPTITKGDIEDLLSGMNDRPALKRQAYAVLNKLFTWAVKSRGDIAISPMETMEAVANVPARERYLSAEELAGFLIAADSMPYPFGPYLLALAGSLQRRETVAQMDWSHLKRTHDQWSIPGRLIKNKLDHEAPCNGEVRIALASRPSKRAGLVFTTTGTTAVSGFSKAKDALDKRMIAVLRARAEDRNEDVTDLDDAVVLPPWRLHDLRRTGATMLQAMGVPVEVTECILAHVGGTREGVAGVYNKYKYLIEKRVALELWGEFLHDVRTTVMAIEPHRKWLYADRLKRLDVEAG